ncbi:MAG: nuclear transport factor 2 family protein [Verrucomicrobiota bacterium]|nr:nuclear transport factor 2 family protein [Verrucomicrobiota bacterium]
MKNSRPVVLFLLAIPFAALAADVSPNESDQILRLEQEWCAAYQRGDADAIALALTDDYTLTDSKGQITGKADDLQDARSGKVHYDVFQNEEMKVRTYGGTAAIVTGKTKLKGTADGKAIDVLVQFTDTLVKVDNSWRLAAGHVSRLPH